jgi:hypothetical protein
MKHSRRPLKLSIGLTLLTLLLFGLHVWHYMPFMIDDAFISFRYAQRLIEGHGLTWNDGERVEGYSNLLWVLVVALPAWFGADMVVGARVLGFLGMSASIVAVLYLYYPRTVKEILPALTGMLSLAATSAMAAWAIGGLEQPLVAALLAWGVVLCYPLVEQPSVSWRTVWLPGLLFALLCLTRPEGIMVAGSVAFGLVLVRGFSWSTFWLAGGLMLLPVAFFLAHLGFRLVYYGEWVPNTALVKISGSVTYMNEGKTYVFNALKVNFPLYLLAAGSLLLSIKQRQWRWPVFLTVPLVTWLAYLAFVGGDIFPAWRRFIPALILMSLLAAHGVKLLQRTLPERLIRVQAGVLFVFLATLATLQFFDSNSTRVPLEAWVWNGKPVGKMLKRTFGEEEPLIAVDSAGCLPYWSELPALDMLGLNDYFIPRHPPPTFGEGNIGHELGHGPYVLRREPDFIIFNFPRGEKWARFLSGKQMQKRDEFFEKYDYVQFQITEPYTFQSGIWVRRESDRIGIERESNAAKVVVPPYLLTSLSEHAKPVVQVHGEQEPVRVFSPDEYIGVENLKLEPGEWKVTVKSSAAPSLRTTVYDASKEEILGKGGAEATFVLPKNVGTEVAIQIEFTGTGKGTVRKLVLKEVSNL